MVKLCHWEIPTTDMAKSKAFYEKFCGWKLQGWSDDYVLFEVEAGVGGALMKVDKMPEPCIRVYLEVEDVAAALKRAEALGCKTGQPKTDIGGGMGFAGSFFDVCGCLIGLWSKT
jgi:predicted enzyme related to lactoylglutathione lyase